MLSFIILFNIIFISINMSFLLRVLVPRWWPCCTHLLGLFSLLLVRVSLINYSGWIYVLFHWFELYEVTIMITLSQISYMYSSLVIVRLSLKKMVYFSVISGRCATAEDLLNDSGLDEENHDLFYFTKCSILIIF